MKLLVETQEGEKIRVGGFMDTKKVQTENGERTYSTLLTRAVKIADADMVVAKKGSTANSEEAAVLDDLTAIKGIGPKAAEKLADLGYTTYAKLAAADERERSILDEDIPAVKGALTRANVFEQAAELAAA
jgi:predicted flap endonuclease-1-like 5' DNA nuclease